MSLQVLLDIGAILEIDSCGGQVVIGGWDVHWILSGALIKASSREDIKL